MAKFSLRVAERAALWKECAPNEPPRVDLPAGSWVELRAGSGQDMWHPPQFVAEELRKAYGYILGFTRLESKGTQTPWQAQVVVKIPWYDTATDMKKHVFARVNAYSSQFAPTVASPEHTFHGHVGDFVVGFLDWQAGKPWNVQLSGWEICSSQEWYFRSPDSYICPDEVSYAQVKLYRLPQLGGFFMGPTPAASNPPWVRLMVPDWDVAQVKAAVLRYGSSEAAFRSLGAKGNVEAEKGESKGGVKGTRAKPPPPELQAGKNTRGGWKGGIPGLSHLGEKGKGCEPVAENQESQEVIVETPEEIERKRSTLEFYRQLEEHAKRTAEPPTPEPIIETRHTVLGLPPAGPPPPSSPPPRLTSRSDITRPAPPNFAAPRRQSVVSDASYDVGGSSRPYTVTSWDEKMWREYVIPAETHKEDTPVPSSPSVDVEVQARHSSASEIVYQLPVMRDIP